MATSNSVFNKMKELHNKTSKSTPAPAATKKPSGTPSQSKKPSTLPAAAKKDAPAKGSQPPKKPTEAKSKATPDTKPPRPTQSGKAPKKSSQPKHDADDHVSESAPETKSKGKQEKRPQKKTEKSVSEEPAAKPVKSSKTNDSGKAPKSQSVPQSKTEAKPEKKPEVKHDAKPESKPEASNLPEYGALCVHKSANNYSILAYLQPGDPNLFSSINIPDGNLLFIGGMQKISTRPPIAFNTLPAETLTSLAGRPAETEPSQAKSASAAPNRSASSNSEGEPAKKQTPQKINLYIIGKLYEEATKDVDTSSVTKKHLAAIRAQCTSEYKANAEALKKEYAEEFGKYKAQFSAVGEKRKRAPSKEPPKKKPKKSDYASFEEIAQAVSDAFVPRYCKELIKTRVISKDNIDDTFTPELLSTACGLISEWLPTCCSADVSKKELAVFTEQNYEILKQIFCDAASGESSEEDSEGEQPHVEAPTKRKVTQPETTQPPKKSTATAKDSTSSSDDDDTPQIQKPQDSSEGVDDVDMTDAAVQEIDLDEADQEPLPSAASQENSEDQGEALGSEESSEDDSQQDVSNLIDNQEEGSSDGSEEFSQDD